ncbi:hypothetical protein AVEN_172178-1 [Araneus ventricosus]|uniref:PiggyBac transposable element-derived protein domain-containing protein n=1 Tax=Araneus ventricosus TaxID=182803 RepID=A0A4Y2JPI2_ARAVE|nr:hypothetical protein AVEN_172178-1 [Araneus ventricosus]
MFGKKLPRESSLLLGRSFGRKVLSNVPLRSLRQFPMEPTVNEIVSLVKIRGLDVDRSYIDEDCGRAQPCTYGVASDKRFSATGTVRENIMAKCPLKSCKILGKMKRGTSDRKFDTKNEIAAVCWNDDRAVSLITNFEGTRCFTKVEGRMKCRKQKVDVPSCLTITWKHIFHPNKEKSGMGHYS